MWSTRHMLHSQRVVLKTAQQWFLSLFPFPQDLSSCSIYYLYIFYDLFLLYRLQKGEPNQPPPPCTKNKWERWTETDTLITWNQGFQKFLPSKIFFKTIFLYGFPHEMVILFYELFLCYSSINGNGTCMSKVHHSHPLQSLF